MAREALRKSNISPKDVMALGITNQRETTIVWDRQTGEPIHNAIVWQDRRTAALCKDLAQAGAESLVRERTGLVIDPYFSGTKIAWLLDELPGARARAERGELAFGTVDTWLTWHLTGNRTHVTDVVERLAHDALQHPHQRLGRGAAAACCACRARMLPDVHPSSHSLRHGARGRSSASRSSSAASPATSRRRCSARRATRPAWRRTPTAPAAFMLLHTGDKVVHSAHGLVSTACAQTAGKEYALEGSVFVGGAVVQWLRDGLAVFFIVIRDRKACRRACSIPAACSSCPPSPASARRTGIRTPAARLIGLTRGTTQRAYRPRGARVRSPTRAPRCSRRCRRTAGEQLAELRVDGGAAANDLLMQFQADLLGVPVVRPRVLETTALGAAYLAGLTVDLWKSREELAEHWQAERRFEPRIDRATAKALMARWREAVDRARNWAV